MTETVMIARTVVVSDPLARANVVEMLAGPGAPAGVACTAAGPSIDVSFDDEHTSAELVDALIAIARTYVPAAAAPPASVDAALAAAAAGLNDPDLDSTRIIETYAP